MKNKIVIGIDQSYKDTGISISMNGKIRMAKHVYLEKCKNNSERRSCKKDYLIFLVLFIY